MVLAHPYSSHTHTSFLSHRALLRTFLPCPFTDTSSTYISFTHTHTHTHSRLFLMTHLSHTTHPLTALERKTLSLPHDSTCSTFARNPFYTHLRQLLRNSFTHSTFTYNSLQLSVLPHLLCLPRLPSTASTTLLEEVDLWGCPVLYFACVCICVYVYVCIYLGRLVDR